MPNTVNISEPVTWLAIVEIAYSNFKNCNIPTTSTEKAEKVVKAPRFKRNIFKDIVKFKTYTPNEASHQIQTKRYCIERKEKYIVYALQNRNRAHTYALYLERELRRHHQPELAVCRKEEYHLLIREIKKLFFERSIIFKINTMAVMQIEFGDYLFFQ